MSFDNTIAALINALNANTEATNALRAQMGQPVQHVAAPAPQVQNVPAVAQAQVQQPLVQQPAQQMPAPPMFGAAPAAAPLAPPVQAAPFNSQQGLFEYTTAAYQGLGAEKGGRIMGILQGLGIQNLNDLKPEQYGQFYAQVEALKAGA